MIVGTRFVAVFGKFLAFFLVGKYFSVKILADYIVLSSLITVLVYVLGIELYTYSVRLFIKESTLDGRKRIFLQQLLFYFAVYILYGIILLFLGEFIEGHNFCFLYIISVFEHLCQELYRIFVALKKQVLANVLLFLKSGFWVFLLFFVLTFNLVDVRISFFYKLWMISSILSFLIGLIYLIKYFNITRLKDLFVNFTIEWYLDGIRSVSIYFTIALILKSIEYGNRLFSSFYLSSFEVAKVGLIFQLVMPISIFIDALIISVIFPKILQYINQNKLELVKDLIKISAERITIIVIVSGIFIILSIDFVLLILNKPNFHISNSLLFLALLVVLFQNIGSLLQIPIYGLSNDKIILRIYLFSGSFFFICSLSFIPILGVFGVFLASGSAFAMLTVFMFRQYLNVLK